MKLKALFASFVMIFSVSFVSCSKKSSSNHDKQGLNFVLQQDNTYAVSAGTSNTLSSIVIPERFNNRPVTKIAEYGFYNHQAKTITITNGITSIGYSAFYGCTSLTSITIPNSVTSIGYHAFYNCFSLQYNEYDNAYYLGNDTNPYVYLVKAKSRDITSCQINENSLLIGDSAFYNCTSLTSIVIPNNVTYIGDFAFSDCTSLTSIVLPNSVTYIGDSALSYCTSLQYNKYDNAYYLGNDTNPYVYLVKAKSRDITSCQINENSLLIGDSAFYNCTSLTSIVIPNSVTYIGGFAFSSCTSLTSIVLPNSVISIGHDAFSFCTSLTSIVIPDSVTSIGSYAFSYCTSLTSIVIPDSVTSIGSYAFYNCSSLQYNEYDNAYYLGSKTNPYLYLVKAKSRDITSCQINKNSHLIGDSAFEDCTSLTSITIPNSVTYIGDSTFSYCTSLISITIPNSVTSIDEYAFRGCSSLTSITIPDGVVGIEWGTFEGCSSLISITIPNSVTYIGNSAFKECTSLTSITIPNSVTSIGSWTFDGCYYLNEVFYTGTVSSWWNIDIHDDNTYLINATRYYYSETRPTDTENNYWRYVDGVPTPW